MRAYSAEVRQAKSQARRQAVLNKVLQISYPIFYQSRSWKINPEGERGKGKLILIRFIKTTIPHSS
jgi:hypothetical protein